MLAREGNADANLPDARTSFSGGYYGVKNLTCLGDLASCSEVLLTRIGFSAIGHRVGRSFGLAVLIDSIIAYILASNPSAASNHHFGVAAFARMRESHPAFWRMRPRIDPLSKT
ncbi:MAG TPA: hypothetical protein VGP68_18690 [Gemmataceae bacterium]|jgi:hypothetical protein|nr:hypothetical protein [Gemmataceae bacterium]